MMTTIRIDQELNGRILDLGGGGEGVIGRIYGDRVTAIDNRQEELDDVPGGFIKLVMDATNLSFSDASFDHVTSFYTMMYIHKPQQAEAIREAARVLKDGGQLHIWDADIASAYPDPFLAELDICAAALRLHTTYGIIEPDAKQSSASLCRLCKAAKLTLSEKREYYGHFYLSFIK